MLLKKTITSFFSRCIVFNGNALHAVVILIILLLLKWTKDKKRTITRRRAVLLPLANCNVYCPTLQLLSALSLSLTVSAPTPPIPSLCLLSLYLYLPMWCCGSWLHSIQCNLSTPPLTLPIPLSFSLSLSFSSLSIYLAICPSSCCERVDKNCTQWSIWVLDCVSFLLLLFLHSPLGLTMGTLSLAENSLDDLLINPTSFLCSASHNARQVLLWCSSVKYVSLPFLSRVLISQAVFSFPSVLLFLYFSPFFRHNKCLALCVLGDIFSWLKALTISQSIQPPCLIGCIINSKENES